ncbi:Protein bimA [Lachnellula subtilissima]|uniref:Protein bimA n=1 Tax=Lachnellula subtilissima TaxID=602034 RepID=A0A8H8UB71_9HELO|nr:Protein bimA [Lachnellula subtilissima]
MAPAPDGVKAQLRQLIYYHIDNNLLTNALFFAERLLAYSHREPESAYLVALCHLRLGDEASAYEYSKSHGHRGTHLGCAYIFAQACLALDKHKDGIVALEKSRGQWGGKNSFGKHTQTTRQPYPDAAAITCLLGKLYFAYENKQKAISCFEEALKLNPFMWDAFTILCDMGTHVRVPNIFKMSPEMEAVLRHTSNGQDHDRNRTGTRPVAVAVASDNGDPFNNVPSKGFGGGLFGTLGMSQKLNESNPSLTNLPAAGGGGIGPEVMETPTGPSASIDITVVPNRRDPGGVSAYSTEPPQAPARKTRTIPGLGMDFSMDAPPKMSSRGITSKRTQKPTDPAEESAATQFLRHTNLSAAGVERKRTVSGQVVPRQMSEDPGAPQRRSVRLFNQIRPTSSKSSSNSSNVPTVGAAPGRELKKARPPISRIMRPNSSTSTVGRQVSGNRKPVEEPMDIDQKEAAPRSWAHPVTSIPTSKPSDSNPMKNEESVKVLLDLFKAIGSGYSALSQYKCQDALHIYKTLPKTQQDTPWVMAQIGRAYYEQAAYTDAEECYKKIRIMAPTRFADMEIYSTILWHLKRETDLAFLAHELVDSSWQSPQAWCALGNSWSLARDHEQALRCFKRATQLDPKFAYAFTLQGHEHVANEEYDKALVSYRHGMAADKRHYNAWYGVGRVYEKLGNYEKASLHFSSASVINPTNAVLICCIGTVLEKQKQPHKALEYFTRATEVAPKSKLTRFKKARALMSLGRLHEALKELMYLKDIAPDEAMVHFLLGRLYKSLREKGAAVRHFTIALNLDPKASQHIKEAIESLEDEDDDDETSMMA